MPDHVRRNVTWFTIVLGLTVLLYLFSIPLAYGMLITAPVAIFLGARILILSRKEKNAAVFRISVTLGLAIAGFSFLLGVSMVFLGTTITALQDCMERAVTNSAQQRCQTEYEDGLNDRLESVYERFGVTPP
ncbi:hypothetical protein [Demequina flava]|uniref:hypothetical protein n=1 Tax=Demequina flava TaxID=1095025 RepID=UPI00128D2E9B|nr:hypothetical protein [Demequina flava]